MRAQMNALSKRESEINRKTSETEISIKLNIDGEGNHTINTGVPFMDHMIILFTVHGFFDLTINATGDTQIDDHHTVEDLGICLGQSFKTALNGFLDIKRYGDAIVPMDETLVQVALDFSNRPILEYNVNISEEKVGTFDTELAQEFLRAFSLHAGLTLHIDMIRGKNAHHIIEATFKALGRALDQATTIDSRIKGTLSSKGTL